ncbi:MAG: thioredoxin family protein [Bacteroidales bacterium]|nr:thioredoxin family protein [Bacteroidales bacterium]
MKKISVLLFSLFLSANSLTQVLWIRNYDVAIATANKSNKLIVMDFWATWCNPCLRMDEKLWNCEEMKKLSGNFICLRLNFDYDLKFVSKYGVRAIPRVIIITAGGEILYDNLGFMDAESYLTVFRAIPGDIGGLNKMSIFQAENKKDLQANYTLGEEFQRIGKNLANAELKSSFLNCSAKYLSKAQNLSTDPVLAEEIELHSILNDIYSGHGQKALKTIEKMNPVPVNEDIAELRHFVLAECYRSIGDQENFQKHKQLIKKQEFLGQLNE